MGRPVISKHDISLSEIETGLQLLRERLRFEPAVESFYEEQTRSSRARAHAKIIHSTLVSYNILGLSDYLLLPQTLAWAVVLHLAVTVLSLGAAAIMIVRPQRAVRESLAVFVPILMFGQIMTIYVMNNGEAAGNYQYLSLVVVILMNSVQKTDFKFAVATSVMIAFAYLGLIWLTGHSSFATHVIGSIMMATVVYASLVARRLLERDARYVFLRRAQDKLQRDAAEAVARRDELTGLFNRRYLDERILHIWGSPDDLVSPAAVLMIDLDHFKTLNDRYGHLAGDMCLTRVASAIVAQLTNKDDIAVRFGGEEFLVLLTRTELLDAVRVAERIRRAIEALGIPHGSSPCGGIVTASFGVMAAPVSESLASDLIAGADAALYAAKRAGRNRVCPSLMKIDDATSQKVPQMRQAS